MEGNIVVPSEKRSRCLSPKSMEGIAWIRSYFERIGDKRPDRAIFDMMVEDLYMGDATKGICFSQFNKIFRNQFPNVTIPKVTIFIYIGGIQLGFPSLLSERNLCDRS